MERISKRLWQSQGLEFKPSRLMRYRIMEYAGNTYVIDMAPHWYSFLIGMFLNFIPARCYIIEDNPNLHYNMTWKVSGGIFAITAGLSASASTALRIISKRIGNQDISMWVRIIFLLIILGICSYWYGRQRKYQKKIIMRLCKERDGRILDEADGYIRWKPKKPLIKNALTLIFAVFMMHGLTIFMILYICLSPTIEAAYYILYPLILFLYYFYIPRLSLENICDYMFIKL